MTVPGSTSFTKHTRPSFSASVHGTLPGKTHEDAQPSDHILNLCRKRFSQEEQTSLEALCERKTR